MKIGKQGLDLIKTYEGYSSEPYKDAAGYWTIGYGHKIKDDENFDEGINKAQATELLKQDVAEAEEAVNQLVEINLEQNQFDALTSFAYNLGHGNLRRSTLLRRVNQREFAHCGKEFLRWVYAGDRALVGLARRRADEARLFLGSFF